MNTAGRERGPRAGKGRAATKGHRLGMGEAEEGGMGQAVSTRKRRKGPGKGPGVCVYHFPPARPASPAHTLEPTPLPGGQVLAKFWVQVPLWSQHERAQLPACVPACGPVPVGCKCRCGRSGCASVWARGAVVGARTATSNGCLRTRSSRNATTTPSSLQAAPSRFLVLPSHSPHPTRRLPTPRPTPP